VNPRIGIGLQHGRRVAEEQAAEVVGNHEGGTRMGTGIPIPKGRRDGAGTFRRVSRETDSTASNDGGEIFGQPQERKPGFTAGPQGPERVGDGAKVSRVARISHS
jgi:hypothetical protein